MVSSCISGMANPTGHGHGQGRGIEVAVPRARCGDRGKVCVGSGGIAGGAGGRLHSWSKPAPGPILCSCKICVHTHNLSFSILRRVNKMCACIMQMCFIYVVVFALPGVRSAVQSLSAHTPGRPGLAACDAARSQSVLLPPRRLRRRQRHLRGYKLR
jgi:hypothetical protein